MRTLPHSHPPVTQLTGRHWRRRPAAVRPESRRYRHTIALTHELCQPSVAFSPRHTIWCCNLSNVTVRPRTGSIDTGATYFLNSIRVYTKQLMTHRQCRLGVAPFTFSLKCISFTVDNQYIYGLISPLKTDGFFVAARDLIQHFNL